MFLLFFRKVSHGRRASYSESYLGRNWHRRRAYGAEDCTDKTLIAGCVSYSPRIEFTEHPKSDSAYVYGHFKQDPNVGGKWHSKEVPTGLVIDSIDSKFEYTIRFHKDNEVYAIKLYRTS